MMTLYIIIMRTIVDIPEEILEQLDALAAENNLSRAEAVRRALAEYLKSRGPRRPNAAFGIWKAKERDGLGYEDSLRKEWNR